MFWILSWTKFSIKSVCLNFFLIQSIKFSACPLIQIEILNNFDVWIVSNSINKCKRIFMMVKSL